MCLCLSAISIKLHVYENMPLALVSHYLYCVTYTSQMIYHRGGEPEQAMHCWFNVMAHKPWITAEFVTVCLLCGKQNFVQPFFWSRKLLRLGPLKLWAESPAHECMDLTWSEFNYFAWFVPFVSSLPLSVMVRSFHVCVNLSCLHSGLPSCWCCTLAVALHRRNSGLGILRKLSEDVQSSWNI